MTIDDLVKLGKGLADKTRIRILQSLLQSSQYLEELSERLGLPLSSASFHLKKLSEAGLVKRVRDQYYAMFEVNLDLLPPGLRDLLMNITAKEPLETSRVRQYREKVISRFMQGGILIQMPSQKKKRLLVLEEIACRFVQGQIYSEKALSEDLEKIYPDYCLLRRLLVDEGFMTRTQGKYQRQERPPVVVDGPPPALGTGDTGKAAKNKTGEGILVPTQEKKTMKTRKELIREAKEKKPVMGIFKIENLDNHKLFLVAAPNLEGFMTRHRFGLEYGSHTNKALLADWKRLGPEKFSFEILEVLEPGDELKSSYLDELKDLETKYLKKLQPFDERGYHDRPIQRGVKS